MNESSFAVISFFPFFRTYMNRLIGGKQEMALGHHGDDLTFLVSSIPPYLVECRLVLGFRNVGIDFVAPGLEAAPRGFSVDDKLPALDALVLVFVGKEPHPGNRMQPFARIGVFGVGNVVLALEVVKHAGKGIAHNIVHVQIINQLNLIEAPVLAGVVNDPRLEPLVGHVILEAGIKMFVFWIHDHKPLAKPRIPFDRGVRQKKNVSIPLAAVAGRPHKAFDHFRFLGLFAHANQKYQTGGIKFRIKL